MALQPAREVGSAIVYKAVNLVNGHSYIGFTSQGLARREFQHRRDARKLRGFRFQYALRKYGDESFSFETMADFAGDNDLAKFYEREAIEKYKPEYNMSHGGEGGAMLPETRKRISDRNKCPRPHRRGVKRSAEVVRNIREKLMGHVTSDDSRAKISEGHKKFWAALPEAERLTRAAAAAESAKKQAAARKRPVVCVNDGKVFESAREAARHYGVNEGWLSMVIQGKSEHVKGLVFMRPEKAK